MNRSKIISSMTALFVALSVLSCASAAKKAEAPSAKTLTGKWEGVDRTGKQGAFQFYEDGSVILIIDGKPLGGPESNGLGKLKFTADFSRDPIKLDIVGIDPTGAERGKILMIVQFVTNNRIKIRTFFNDVRPENFDNETIDDTIVLERLAE